MPHARIYAMLGNDDMRGCVSTMERLHGRGLITLISDRVVEIEHGLSLVGYPYVRTSEGKFYDGWEKPEEEILEDLSRLEALAGGSRRTIFVVHDPPFTTKLDQSFNETHLGSAGVRNWLSRGPKYLLLSGHIHEAPFLNGGIWREEVEGTLCMQAGAWHDDGLCAITFDLENPHDAYWIHDKSKVRK